jgi:2-keto-4-pentenoate hydratase/2-oxohepta-3-ene-1,7-dioic acid hydratase in catechol pathway
MRLATIITTEGPRAAMQVGRAFMDLNHTDPNLPANVRAFLELGADGIARAQDAMGRRTAAFCDASEVLLAPPVTDPKKIIGIGRNYAAHAAEAGVEPPKEPVIFAKFNTTLNGHDKPVPLPPPEVSTQVDYEAELVIVVGKAGRFIKKADAYKHIAGYSCGNDVSVRDWQRKEGGQWVLGKSFDGAAPLGPVIVTADELPNPHKLRIQLRLNGKTMQDANTSEMIFKCDDLVTYISQACTLQPGDLIYTGTPSGVGASRTPPVWLKDGDVTEIEIEEIGVLKNTFKHV